MTNRAVTPTSDNTDLTSVRSITRSATSRLENGSSSSSSRGDGARARAKATRCCWPPDSSEGILAPRPPSPTRSSISDTLPERALLRARPNAMFDSTSRWGNRAPFWNTMPMPRRSGATHTVGDATTFWPMVTWPAVGRSRPAMQRNKVVLPQPLGPSNAIVSPAATDNDSECSTWLAP
ncbi:MAG: hypothetical protein R2770_05245 [Acidimicrobiales bacterium]